MENPQIPLKLGRIYVIRNDIDNKEYYGSTFQTKTQRWNDHKKKAKKCPNRKIYKHMNEIGTEHFRIIVIEEVLVKNKDELRKKEDEYIVKYKPELNTYNAVLNIENKDKLKKEYCAANREKLCTLSKMYYAKNKVKVNEKQQQYRQNNPEKMQALYKKYNEKRQAKKSEMGKQNILNCACGSNYRIDNKARHEKTEKHKKYLVTSL